VLSQPGKESKFCACLAGGAAEVWEEEESKMTTWTKEDLGVTHSRCMLSVLDKGVCVCVCVCVAVRVFAYVSQTGN
jgi:hypothetical protein